MVNQVTSAVAALGIVVLLVGCANGRRGLPAMNGIANFGRVNSHLYRGAQPDALAFQILHQRYRIKTVLNLRSRSEEWPDEAPVARQNRMTYERVRMSGWQMPSIAQIECALSVIETSRGAVYVHCEYGCDRTGTVIACYRIKHDGWSVCAALTEAKMYGMADSEVLMKLFIERFARRYPFKFGQ
jgi:protein tyrosine/serine phosphatase